MSNEKFKIPKRFATEEEWLHFVMNSPEFKNWRDNGPDVIGSESYRDWYRWKYGEEFDMDKWFEELIEKNPFIKKFMEEEL